ncbi:prolipoprotein diacylglyceryl transferase [Patescibacteria group bacterium]|nr:prolipoprotein diacylglyceryl transferase [Patescibacteria group bacterium]
MFLFEFLHNYNPQPILLRLGIWNIHWYGLLITLAILLGLFLVLKMAPSKKQELQDLFFYLLIFGFLGARIYYVFNELPYYWSHPLSVFKIWEGGLGIYGAVIGGILTLFFYARKRKISFWYLADLLAPVLILGQALGRWGNYFNQEIFGYPTNLPWGIPIEIANRPSQFLNYQYFHPCFFYEFIGNLLIFGFLFFLLRKRLSKNKFFPGIVFACYLILYALLRFFLEFLRLDHEPVIFSLRFGQLFAVLAIVTGVFILFKNRRPLFKVFRK